MPKPVSKQTDPTCTKITLKVGIRANIGNYEDIQVEAMEEYSLDTTVTNGNTRSILMSNLVKFLQTEIAQMLEPLELPNSGKSPAGQLAIYMKECKKA